MDQTSVFLNKSFGATFILEKSKLLRLLNIIEEKYKSIGKKPKSIFAIILKNGKQMGVNDIEHVLGHDNAIKNPIDFLGINYECHNEDDVIDYDITYSISKSEIKVTVKSSNVRFANELFAEIEEQVERAIVKSWISNLKRTISSDPRRIAPLIVSIIMMLILIPIIILVEPQQNIYRNNFLSNSDIQHILKLSEKVQTIDDKINLLYKYNMLQLDNIKTNTNLYSFKNIFLKFDLKLIFILLPFFIIIFSFVYLLIYCYPGSLFLWGDYEDYYNRILNKRKFVFNTILVALFIGIIGSLFVYAFSKVFS